MTTAYWCILVISLLPYIWVTFAKTGPGYSNRAPRLYADALTGWRQRAYWAHLNAFEAIPSMIGAILIAHLRQVPQHLIDQIALGFIAFRIFHGIFYVVNQHILRSLAWFGAFACMIALFVLSA